MSARRDGSIDRTVEREKTPFLERCETTRGLEDELWHMHQLIQDGEFLPVGSDISIRFSLLMGIAMGHLMKLEEGIEHFQEGNMEKIAEWLEATQNKREGEK